MTPERIKRYIADREDLIRRLERKLKGPLAPHDSLRFHTKASNLKLDIIRVKRLNGMEV